MKKFIKKYFQNTLVNDVLPGVNYSEIDENRLKEIERSTRKEQSDAFKQLDKAILTLSSASLGLVLTFTKDFGISHSNFISVTFLFIFAIALTVSGLILSGYGCKSLADNAIQVLNSKNLEKAIWTPWQSKIINILNILSFFAFFTGLLVLGITVSETLTNSPPLSKDQIIIQQIQRFKSALPNGTNVKSVIGFLDKNLIEHGEYNRKNHTINCIVRNLYRSLVVVAHLQITLLFDKTNKLLNLTWKEAYTGI